MQDKILQAIDDQQAKQRPSFAVGDRVTVNVKLKEGDKERIQAFKGVVISKHPKSGKGPGAMFTVRKISEGVGVEKIFPLHSPVIDSIQVEGSSVVRRSRLYYLRGLEGKKARLKDAERFGDVLVTKKPDAGTEIAAEASETPAS